MNRLGFFWIDKESTFSLTVKQRFENTNYEKWMKRSSRRKIFIVFIKETNNFDESWTIIGTKSRDSWCSWAIPRLYIRHNCEDKIVRGSRYPWTHWQDTQESQKGFNCVKNSRDFQDAESVRSGHFHVASQLVSFPLYTRTWWNAEPFSVNAEPQRRAAKHLGHRYIWKRFWQIQQRLLQRFIRKSWIHGVLIFQNTHQSCDEWRPNTSSGSEMPVRAVSQKFSHPL